MPLSFNRPSLSALALSAASFAAPACADDALAGIRLFAVTAGHELIAVSAAEPGKITHSVKLVGLANEEQILGIDFRVAHGVMFALGSSGRVFNVDVGSGNLKPVSETPLALDGQRFGFDFNPAADRIRIVSDSRQNLRVHPQTGALVDATPDTDGVQPDAALAYADDDAGASLAPRIIAAAYTYNTRDEKLTTNFAIDANAATLVRQGSIEGEEPIVSPNTGQLRTVGALGVDAIADAHFDISDVTNTALAVFSTQAAPQPTLYRVDLATGAARMVGALGRGEALRGIAIEP